MAGIKGDENGGLKRCLFARQLSFTHQRPIYLLTMKINKRKNPFFRVVFSAPQKLAGFSADGIDFPPLFQRKEEKYFSVTESRFDVPSPSFLHEMSLGLSPHLKFLR